MRTHARAALAAGLFSLGVVALGAGAANAHTPYLLPQDFTPDAAVSVEAAFATQFFTPTIALGSSDFHVVTPEGSNAHFNSMEVVAPRTTLGLTMATRGTYRITTGEIIGPVTQMVGVDGGWRALAAGEAPPEGAPLTTLQTVTLAEAYVTRGAPNQSAIAANTGRLLIRPVTHPNRIELAQGFAVQLLFDGQPFANMPLVLYASGDQDANLAHAFVTDANGAATLTFTQPGNYVVAVRHRANAAPGSAAQVQSFTTALTFEVYATLPQVEEAAEQEPEQPRRRRGGSWMDRY